MSLSLKMATIMGAISGVEKDAKMSAGKLNYRYVTDVNVYHTVRKLLIEYGIALFASMTDVEQDRIELGTDQYGNVRDKYHTRARFEFMLVDSETGETMTCVWYAESDDSGDKGVNKCATAALKYWLLKTFIIPTGDDPDAEPSGAHNRTGPLKPTRESRPRATTPEHGEDPRQPETLDYTEDDTRDLLRTTFPDLPLADYSIRFGDIEDFPWPKLYAPLKSKYNVGSDQLKRDLSAHFDTDIASLKEFPGTLGQLLAAIVEIYG